LKILEGVFKVLLHLCDINLMVILHHCDPNEPLFYGN
jgi:hypothetical protein